MKVGLIGDGDRAEALIHLLQNHQVYQWTTREEGPAALPSHVRQADVGAFKQTPLIFICLPIHRLRAAAGQLGGVLSGRHVLVHTTRNLEPTTLNPPSTILAEETPTLRFGFLSGPFDADDVLAGRPTSGVCASEFDEVHDLVADALNTAGIRVYRAKDLRGAELAAAYTRVIALMVGIGRQAELGASLEATLVTRGLAEAARFVVYHGGYESSVWGMAGCANLYLDVSKQPTRAGADSLQGATGELALGMELQRRTGDAAEPGADAIREAFPAAADDLFNLIESLGRVPKESGLDLPILRHAVELIRGEASAPEVVKSLLGLPVYFE